MMKKLHELKSWLTLADTAKCLSLMLHDNVTVADVLQLVLEGHLRLSVNLIDGEFVKTGTVIPIEQAVEVSSPKSTRDFFEQTFSNGEVKFYKGVKIDDDRVLDINHSDDITAIRGIFDLIILECFSMELERIHHELCNAEIEIEIEIRYVGDGIFVESEKGQIYQLQRRWDENHYKYLNANTPIHIDDETVVSYSELLNLMPETDYRDPNQFRPAYKISPKNPFLIRKANIEQLIKIIEKKEQPVEKPKYTHTSELMQIMDKAIVEFWENHDTKNPPKSEVIKQWIKENYGHLSDREITALDSIMRPLRYKLEKKR
jgi:hypothetical protein